MCVTCGCSANANVRIEDIKNAKNLTLRPIMKRPKVNVATSEDVITMDKDETTLRIEKDILSRNQTLAEENRTWLSRNEILALNLMSSPGSGKTTLLARTIRDLQSEFKVSVIEGDQETSNDAERIRETGCKVIQINTGAGCHLDASMIKSGLTRLSPDPKSIVMVENVGNLVCPALFDLGEKAKVVIFSVTEGEDKPLKYPHMFRSSEILLLNKIDLLPYVSFDVERCLTYARRVNPSIRVFQISATRGDGLNEWYQWLRQNRASERR